ncbi:HAD-IA family hydrolase [Paenibacillus polygoni]|uniref:HAD-IA family hydrolase n=1 Tax=Paenibacillus polygoni TaxID=3050112 RepID=A0ABY8X1P2_9BACL|nr:HAD-IA family hydrolase [Paenibacillus polygoni]WIV18402.1 HAD-IA family hydrolase [Paenibacillus polygoni]
MVLLKTEKAEAHVSGILFDKDGTLLDLNKLWTPWATFVLDQLEKKLASLGRSFTGHRDQVFGTQYNSSGSVIGYDAQGPFAIATVSESTGILAWQLYAAGMPWNDAITYVRMVSRQAMSKVKQEHAHPTSGLIPFLIKCREKGLRLGVVTADSTDTAEIHLRWLGILDYFDVIIGYDQVKNSKPHPESAYACCAKLGLSPQDCAVIGDSNGDMQMAKSAESALAVGFIQSNDSFYLHDADTVITSYTQISLE